MDNELKEFWAKALQQLIRANADKKHAFRSCVLASVYKEKVNQRTVIHRQFSNGNTSLIYTDSRSKKVAQLEKNPISSLLFYDSKNKLQISVAGLISVHTDDEFSEIEKKKVENLDDYTNAPLPGVGIVGSGDYKKGDVHFTVLQFNWLEVDLLQLNRNGHKRAILRRDENKWTGTWIVP
jgi:hypothetical protein